MPRFNPLSIIQKIVSDNLPNDRGYFLNQSISCCIDPQLGIASTFHLIKEAEKIIYSYAMYEIIENDLCDKIIKDIITILNIYINEAINDEVIIHTSFKIIIYYTLLQI